MPTVERPDDDREYLLELDPTWEWLEDALADAGVQGPHTEHSEHSVEQHGGYQVKPACAGCGKPFVIARNADRKHCGRLKCMELVESWPGDA